MAIQSKYFTFEFTKTEESFETKIKKEREKQTQVLSQLGISDLETNGMKMLQFLRNTQKSLFFTDQYNHFARQFSLPSIEKTISFQTVTSKGGVSYFSIRSIKGEEIAVATEEEFVSQNLLVAIEERIRFILDQYGSI